MIFSHSQKKVFSWIGYSIQVHPCGYRKGKNMFIPGRYTGQSLELVWVGYLWYQRSEHMEFVMYKGSDVEKDEWIFHVIHNNAGKHLL